MIGRAMVTVVVVVLVLTILWSPRAMADEPLAAASPSGLPISFFVPTPAPFNNSTPNPSAGAPSFTGPTPAPTTSRFFASGGGIAPLECGGPTYQFIASGDGLLHVTTSRWGTAQGVIELNGTVTAIPIGDGPTYEGRFDVLKEVASIAGAVSIHTTLAMTLVGSDGSVATQQIVSEMLVTANGAAADISISCP